jgi:hypothetical protein
MHARGSFPETISIQRSDLSNPLHSRPLRVWPYLDDLAPSALCQAEIPRRSRLRKRRKVLDIFGQIIALVFDWLLRFERGGTINFPGNIRWDGKYLLIGDQEAGSERDTDEQDAQIKSAELTAGGGARRRHSLETQWWTKSCFGRCRAHGMVQMIRGF